jgi:hypothetical protein
MMIERNMLSLLMSIIRNNTTVEYKILMRQLAMRNEKDHTFINRIQEVIQKYKLESFLTKLMTCQNLQNKLLNITVLFIWYLLASLKKNVTRQTWRALFHFGEYLFQSTLPSA